MPRTVLLAISAVYVLGLLLAVLVFAMGSSQILSVAAALPEITLLFYLILLLIKLGKNTQLVLALAGMVLGVISTFLVVYFVENNSAASLSTISNLFRILFYALSFGYVANQKLGIKTLRNINYWSLMGGSIVVLLPALYLLDIDEKGFKWNIAVQYVFSFVLLIQSLRRFSLVPWKAYLAGVISVLSFVLSDTFFGFSQYYEMPVAYELSHVMYYVAQYFFILGIQFQYTSRRWVRPV